MLYAPPAARDMAVCVVIFRPVPWQKTALNFARVVQELNSAGMPTFIAELSLPGPTGRPLTADFSAEQKHKNQTWVFESEHVLFHKENLQNVLAGLVPENYQKLCFIDADVLFTNPYWYDALSQQLDDYDIMQPMDWCEWLSKDDQVLSDSAVNFYGKIPAAMLLRLENKMRLERCHPGFSWAFRRETFNKIGGFYERQPVGSGDAAFAYALGRDTAQMDANATRYAIQEFAYVNTHSYQNYRAQVQTVAPRVGYLLDNTAKHLYHGELVNRGHVKTTASTMYQFAPRHQFLPPIDPAINEYPFARRGDGILEWTNPDYKTCLLPYFQSRNEDS